MSDLHTSTVKCIKTLKLNPHGLHSLIKLLLKSSQHFTTLQTFQNLRG